MTGLIGRLLSYRCFLLSFIFPLLGFIPRPLSVRVLYGAIVDFALGPDG